MNKLIEMLKSIRPDVDFTREASLIDDGILDSVDVLSIVAKIKESFGIEISIGELDPEDFNSATTIQRLIERKTNS